MGPVSLLPLRLPLKGRAVLIFSLLSLLQIGQKQLETKKPVVQSNANLESQVAYSDHHPPVDIQSGREAAAWPKGPL